MKKYFYLGAWGIVLLLACAITGCSNKTPRIIVNMESEQMDTLEVLYATVANYKEQPTNLLVARDKSGVFKIAMPNDENTYGVWIHPLGAPLFTPQHLIRVNLFPGENLALHVKADKQTDILDYTLTGSPVQEAEASFKAENYQNLEYEIQALSTSLGIIKTEERRQAAEKYIRDLQDSIQQIQANYIMKYPNEMLSGYFVTQLKDPHLKDSLYGTLGDAVRNSNMKELLDFSVRAAQ